MEPMVCLKSVGAAARRGAKVVNVAWDAPGSGDEPRTRKSRSEQTGMRGGRAVHLQLWKMQG
ncbi:hypothetical protein C4E04_20410 [Microvirga sp. 17 mud 1-3]|nr:hypothetical protein C4E04_20410 [Microvirga sp. 17 mud 1-3]